MQEIQVGHFIGKVTDYGMTETKNGDPQISVSFDIEFADVSGEQPSEYTRNMAWRGTLKEGKGLEITLRALLALGMTGNDPLAMALGPDGGPVNLGAEAMLDIQKSEYDGKIFKKIAWVNSATGGGIGKRITAAEAKAKLASRNLAGTMAALKAKEGIKDDLHF